MGKRYLNWNGETIDELDPADFARWRDFTREKKRLREEYALAGMGGAYWSQRPYAGWN